MSKVQTQVIDTLICARWIIPVRPRRSCLEHHSLAIDGGKIIALLPSIDARQRFSPREHIELPHHAITPGLINAHGHAAMSLFRGMADDQALQSWLQQHIWPAEGQWVSEEFVYDGAQLAIAEMLRSGTTCFSDMYFFPEATARAASEAGIRAQLCFPIFDFPCNWGQGPDDYIHKGLMVRDDYKHSERIDIVFGPHAPYTVGDEALSRVATLAAELDAPLQIHLHETASEVSEAVKNDGQRPIARLDKLGLLTPRSQLVHMTTLNADDIATVKASGAHIVHCPESNMKLASGFCPVQLLLDQGINVALGTDGAASNNDLDLFGEMRSAALLAKAVAGDAAALPAWQALEMATLSGARALGLDDKIGSLEVGKCADLIAIDLGEIEQQPIFDPLSQLVYSSCGHRVSHSWVAGEKLMSERTLSTLDSHNIIRKAYDWQQKISATH